MYGIELETITTVQPRNGQGTHRERGEVLTEIDSDLWVAGDDGSIGGMGAGENGVEFKTIPVEFCTQELNRLGETMPQVMSIFGCRVNQSCGTHISHSTIGVYTPAIVTRLGYFALNFQQAFYAMTGTMNRENNDFAHTLRDYPVFRDYQFLNADGANWGSIRRQNWLNLTELQRSNPRLVPEGTRIEFRVFSATTQVKRIVAWSNICHSFLRFVESGSTRVTAPQFGRYAGAGRASFEALLDTLAYTRRANDTWVSNDVISKVDGVSLVRDLVSKYDTKRQANGSERIL